MLALLPADFLGSSGDAGYGKTRNAGKPARSTPFYSKAMHQVMLASIIILTRALYPPFLFHLPEWLARFRQRWLLFWRAFALRHLGSTMLSAVALAAADDGRRTFFRWQGMLPWRFAVARRNFRRAGDSSTPLIGLTAAGVGNGSRWWRARKRATGYCCRRGRHCPAIYAVLLVAGFLVLKRAIRRGWDFAADSAVGLFC